MDGSVKEGGGEEHRTASSPEDDKATEGSDAPDAAEDSGATVSMPGRGSEEQAEAGTEQTVSHSLMGTSGAELAHLEASASEQVLSLPLPPYPSQLSSANRGTELMPYEDDEGDGGVEDLVVLDPEHPLMKRFQAVLKTHLSKQLERLNLDLREKLAMEKSEASQREALGVELYSVQLELARLQAQLEAQHEANMQANTQHRQALQQLEVVRGQHLSTNSQTTKQRARVTQLQAEVESVASRLFYMKEVSDDLRSDIAVMKNASRKAGAEKTEAEELKQKQDLYVERLTKNVERLTEEIGMYEVQTVAQTQETQAAKEALGEAQLEMDALQVERKQLMQQWNSSLVGMRKRDEAYTAMQDALLQANHEVHSLDTEIEGFKKSITAEEERNELLTVLLNRAQLDGATWRKLIGQCQSQQEALHSQYSTYTRMLHEHESSLSRLNVESSVRQSEVMGLRKQLEKESSVRLALEERIVAKLQEQFTHDQAAKYSKRLTGKMATHKRELESQLSVVENELAGLSLSASEAEQRVETQARVLAEQEQEISRRHALLSASEAQVAKQVTVIERKQATINLYNKRIQQIVAATGHEDLGPLEIRASTLSKELEEVASEMKEQQQFWLWQQGELVRLSQEKQTQSTELHKLQTQYTILQQRKVRTESEIEQERREQSELERHMKGLRGDMLKLNSLLSDNSQLRQALEQGNVLMENEFLTRLKEAERDAIDMQMQLEKIQEEKERLLNSLVEAERQVMLWEKKIQLVRETRLAVDSEVGQGDIKAMKTEIHRMEVRYTQLLKQQEQLLRDMESAVERRESIVLRSEAQARFQGQRKPTTNTDLHNILLGLRRKTTETHKQAEECDGVLEDLRASQDSLSGQLREKQQYLTELCSASTVLADDLNNLQDSKSKNLARLVALQGRTKQLVAVREGRYTPLASGEAPLSAALQREQERLAGVATVLQRICHHMPQHQGALRRITLALSPHVQQSQ
ncbi:coiled-coil domain-containing protein 40 [Engraulis encrasicolus]|uniref:coiled-coil domain-containing protein 40 n=1 Tax=Engraulis encrasicolus TaxID=184585 RepID=UPI002FD0DA63